MADKCIGKLTLDISDVEKKIKDINEFLGKIGANINLEDKLSKKISNALKNLVNEAKKAGEEAAKAMDGIAGAQGIEDANKKLAEATKIWKEYYQLMTKSQNARNSGRSSQADYYKQEAEALVANVQELRKKAEATEAVTKAMRSYEASKRAGDDKAVAESIRNEAKAHLEVQKAIESASKARERAQQTINNQSIQNEKVVLEDLIRLYAKKAQMDTEATKAIVSGNMENANLYLQEEAEIEKLINVMSKLWPEIDKVAQANDRVRDAELKRQAAANTAKQKSDEVDYKQRAEDINNYAVALTKMLTEQAKFNQQVASGKLVEGSDQYAQAEEKLRHLESAAIQAGQKLDSAGREAAMGMQEVKTAIDNVNVSMGAINDSGNVSALTQIENAYKLLTTAIRDYNLAKKANNEEGMVSSQKQIDNAMQTVSLIEQGINALNVDEATRERILYIIEQCKIQQDAQSKGVIATSQSTSDLESQVNGLLTRYLSITAVIRTITSLMRNMVEYVSEYSDKMNEIQMITMKTDAEVEKLATTYRDLAKDMSVSSLDMADAAIYFTRQGLGAAEIEKRLKNVTMYAKAANVEFKDASEIITAVVNSMGLVEQEAEDGREAAQRVADVFLNIGDNAATSGQEIGEAMQKAAASAGAFGVSMEWLAAYIATVSETTRQEARTIGTAFNTIIARLHQIKQTGYNQEDETKVNDIAKALSKIDVVLMDQSGNWRDMEVILEEIASKWGELDGKTKSYIATTMAGVKQQNVFLALMNDMSKGIEGNSRAFELHELAMNSDGVAAEKYAVYLDSVTAAHERLKVSQEDFYSLLDQSIIKDFYNVMAGIIDYFTKATEAANGLNIVIPLIVGGIALLNVAITALESHPIILTITGIIAGVGALNAIIGALAGSVETMADKFQRANNVLSQSQLRLNTYFSEQQGLKDMIEDIGTETPITSEKLKEYSDLLDDIGSISPTARQAVDDFKNGLIDQTEAAKILNEELEKVIDNEQKISVMSFVQKMASWEPGSTEDSGLKKSMLNWHDDWTGGAEGLEGFGNQLKQAYEHRKKHLSSILLDTDTYDYINQILPEGDNVDWGYIGQLVWSKFLGNGNPDSMLNALRNEVDGMINEAVNIVGVKLNDVEKGAFEELLIREIIGEDNELSQDEYRLAGQKISTLVYNLMTNGFANVDITPNESLQYIGERLFGEYFSLLFGDQFESLKNDPEFDVISSYITRAISELIENGFSDTEIASVLEGMDMRDWGSVVGVMKQKLRDAIKANAGVDGLGISIMDLVTGEETYDQGLWLDLDTTTLKLVNDMVLAGTEFEKIQFIMSQSHTVDEFKTKLAELSEEMGISGEEAEEAAFSFSDIIKAAKAGIKDIQAIDAAIESVKKSLAGEENINYGDIFGLVELHPEIMTVIGDSEKLLETLKKIREEAGKKQEESFVNMLLNTEGVINNTQYADSGFATLGDYRKSIEGDEAALRAFDAEILEMANNLQLADENYKQMSKDAKEAEKDATSALKEAQKALNESVKEVETLDKTIAKLQDNKKIDFSDIVGLSAAHPELVAFANDADKLLEMLERLKEEAKSNVKDMVKNAMLDSEDYFKESQYYNEESGIKTMREYITYLHESRGNWSAVAAEVDQAAQDIVDASDASSTAAETWLDAQMKIAEINDQVSWAKANNFEEQIRQLQEANERGGIQEALTLFNSWDDQMQQAVGSTYPAFVLQIVKARKAIEEQGNETVDLTKQTESFGIALSKVQKLNDVKYFKDSAKAIKQLSDGTISATDAYDVYTKEVNKVTKAYEDILDVQNKMAYNSREVNKDNQQAIDAADVNNLASLLGMTTEEILADFPAAVDMFNELTGAAGELTDVLNMLNEAAFIKITGTSEADFSEIQNGLISTQGMAKETIDMLLATGQWMVETKELNQEAWVNIGNGKWEKRMLTGMQQILKPSGNNPFKGRSTVSSKADTKQKSSSSRSGGGGGGGSNSKTNSGPTEVEQMLDLMSQVNSIQGGQQSYYQSQQKYYSQTGKLQGVIAYMQREKEVLEEQNPVLEKNIKQIERYIAQKKAELATLSTDDEAYKEVADDLDKLQDAHQKYTKQIVDNKTALEALNQQMDEQRKKIRQMEIDLRNTILGAIEDREKKRTDMLNAEIEMENKILGLIRQRYEKERDQIIETTNLKIDALNTESSLLEEQLRIRREQAEAEDKAAKLRELEVKYQRILADPTRAKEAQNLKSEIDALRKEMAWDLSEEEVKSQQDSIDQQIESLEDYQEYIENYYEDLFEHPQKLIEEMRQIMMGTQEEIINWLKTNDDEYKNSSENTQMTMVEGWTKTYNDMKGILKLYWEEVEEIIAQGDDYIIEFLKNNSADYAQAGKLQAEAYVDEWKKQLSDLKKAHEAVAADVAASYSTIAKYTGSGSSGSSGSGSSSSSSSNGSTSSAITNGIFAGLAGITEAAGNLRTYYYNTADPKTLYSSPANASNEARKSLSAAQQANNRVLSVAYASLPSGYKFAYAKGGLANYTGPAWVDGTASDPERILSPYQTKLFETMVTALERMATIPIDSMPNLSDVQTTGGSPMSFGDIVVNVDNLDTDDDYEELAEKVGNVLMEKIGRTAVVGGLRIRSV